ncbi:4-hydroxy-tetrahydrodipicolinate synthase [Desulfonema magnum]|uniref:4-hydroxy-tetrahydrodipicolinate synthase n=1 Tax=Desulfonema magnum TaxID=45655 RepID=A0A975GPY3_9BACT|nr:4-hydroxy-tetrahydrodipicolinate synthase [Desulfonema magnum]QTA89486.1 4-hydroxy-tetrahydrodipicolinate synthase [Desulfonema magnum]
MLTGSYTALITPFTEDTVDHEGLEKLVDFQMKNGISGILAVGTTGESPTLTWNEHNLVIETVAQKTKNKCTCIAGTGSNNTKESLEATKHAADIGVDAVLLVEPYYNGPSSLEIRKEYIAPVAAAFPDVQIIPYIIPGRTGTQLFPEDLGLLSNAFKNINAVKEATGNIENMRRTRECCGPDFTILSGDDGMTYKMMTDSEVKAGGLISVASNIAPRAVSEMIRLLEQGNFSEAQHLASALQPLSELVTVTTTEKTPYGNVVCRARNPLAAKTLMSILGMPSGRCRQPIGKMTLKGLEKVLAAGRKVQAETPEIFKPLADFFNVDIDERLNTPSNWESLAYEDY